jgi:hypothetical protein
MAGFEFDLECCESRIARQFRRTFLPFAGAESSAAHRYVVDSDGERLRLWFDEESVRVDDSWEWLYAYLEWHAVQTALSRAEGFVALHAAALARNDGALLLSGPSGAGKSTLTLELLRHGGWRYMSDEAVLLTSEGVRGFPRAIVLKAGPDAEPAVEVAIAERLYCPPWEASVEVVTATVAPRAVVLLSETGTPTMLARMSGAQAFPHLLEQAFASRENPVVAEAIAGLLQRTPVYSLSVDRVEDAAELLIALFDSPRLR